MSEYFLTLPNHLMMLHEAAVAWFRARLTLTLPKAPWLETREEFRSRLKQQAAYINEHYAVENLCREFPQRLETLIARSGDGLRK